MKVSIRIWNGKEYVNSTAVLNDHGGTYLLEDLKVDEIRADTGSASGGEVGLVILLDKK